MKQRRLMGIPEPLEGDQGTLLVSFCIPNTRDWRAVTTALLSQFAYGRAYDERTGSVLGALEVGREIFNSMSMCDLDQINRSIRQLTAVIGGQVVDYTQDIPDQEDFSNTAFGILPMLHEHLQSLGPIPKQGDTIMTSLQKLVEAEGYTGLTIDELTAQINQLEPGLFDRWKDYLEILSFMSEIFPGVTRVDIVGDFFQKLSLARYRHNDLTIKGYQATALRGIMRSLAPFDDDPEADEQSLLERYGSIPWLGKAAIALAEPTPGGEAWLAASTIAQVIKTVFDKLSDAWQTWFDKWINQVENPTPSDNVTTAISSLAGVIGGLDLTTGPEGSSPFGNISAALLSLSGSIQQVAQRCSLCGSSGGCGCDGADYGNPAALPNIDDGYTEGDPAPDGWLDLPDLPGSSNYQTRKCKISNLVHSGIVSFVGVLASKASEITAAKGLAQSLGIAFMITVLSIAFGEVLTPVPVIDAIFFGALGLAATLAVYLVGQDVLFAPLQAALTSRQEDLVCALYNSTNVGQAKADYQAVLVDEGINSVTAGICGIIISANWGGLLFADVSGFSDELDAALSSYTGPIDCDVCAGDPWWDCSFGVVQDYDPTFVEIEAVQVGDGMYLTHIGVDVARNISATNVGWSAPTASPGFATAYDTSVNRCGSGGGSPWTVKSASFLPGPDLCHGRLYRSSTPFTVTFTDEGA